MKKFFNEAELELIVFAANDIITTSGEDDAFAGEDDVIE